MCGALSAFAMLAVAAEARADDSVPMTASRVFKFDALPKTPNANGGWARQVMHGTLPTGEFVEIHETMLPPGQMPHPAHRHPNTEFALIREGKLEFMNNGKSESAGPGDVIYAASNVLHGWKNVGDGPATYFIVSVGVQLPA
jgi:quercetin dioxygenase-like cupin family protein